MRSRRWRRLEIGPPERLAVGRGTAFAIGGYAYSPAGRTRGAGACGSATRSSRSQRFGLPRDDVYGAARRDDPARPLAYRSGFVSMVDLDAGRAGRAARARAGADARRRRRGASRRSARSSCCPASSLRRTPSPRFPGGGPRVAICMATYEPPADLLRRQLDSLREQTHGNWICLISDDASSDEAFERIVELTEGDPRFVVSRSPEPPRLLPELRAGALDGAAARRTS